MNRIKSTVAVLLLFVITVIVVFGPHIVNRQSDKKLTEETAYWNYNNQNAAKITDKQVAALYYNGEIDVDMYANFERPVSEENEGQDNNESYIKEDIGILFDTVFKEDETIRSCMKEMISDSAIEYSQTGTLVMVEDRPVVLNFVCVVAQTVHGTIGIAYEQKTHTIIDFYYYSVYPLDETNSIKSEILQSIVKNYYKKQLSLNDKQFYVQYEKINKNDFEDYYMLFGISQHQKVIESEKDEYGGSYVVF